MTIATLSVCMRCKPAGWMGDEERRPGLKLAERVVAELARAPLAEPVALRTIRCMSQCKRPCVAAVVETLRLYVAKPDGFMERAKRPHALRAGVLGRVPPLGSATALTVSEALFASETGANRIPHSFARPS